MKIVFYLGLIMTLFSCGRFKQLSTISYQKMKEQSIIQLPVSIQKQDLENYVNTLIPDTLFEGSENEGLPAQIRVYKGSFLGISLDRNILSLNIPLRVFVFKRMGFLSGSGEGGLVLHLRSRLDIDSTWHLQTLSSLDEYEWTSEPKIKLLGFQLNVKDWAAKYIRNHQAEWLQTLDDSLSKMDDIVRELTRLKARIQAPIPIDSSNNLYISLRLDDIGLLPFETSGNVIKTGIRAGFDAGMKRTKTLSSAQDSSLPAFHWIEEYHFIQENTLALTLLKEDLQYLAGDWIKQTPPADRSLELRGKKIIIDRIKVLTRGNKIGARLYYSGDRMGSLLFLAMPIWNHRKKEIRLLDEELELDIDHTGSKILYFFFKRSIKKRILKSIEESINEKIHSLVEELQEQINRQVPQSTVLLRDYALDPIQVQQDALFADAHLSLTAKLVVRGIHMEIKEK